MALITQPLLLPLPLPNPHNHCVHLGSDSPRKKKIAYNSLLPRRKPSMASVICTTIDTRWFWTSSSSYQLSAKRFVANTSKRKILESFGAEHHSYKMAQHLMAVPLRYRTEKGRESLEADFIQEVAIYQLFSGNLDEPVGRPVLQKSKVQHSTSKL